MQIEIQYRVGKFLLLCVLASPSKYLHLCDEGILYKRWSNVVIIPWVIIDVIGYFDKQNEFQTIWEAA